MVALAKTAAVVWLFNIPCHDIINKTPIRAVFVVPDTVVMGTCSEISLFVGVCLLSISDATGAVHCAGGHIRSKGRGAVFAYNKASNDGGAIATNPSNKINVFNAKFEFNTAEDRGGAIYMASPNVISSLVYQRCQFSSNNATNGGAIYFEAEDATLVMKKCGVNGNYAGMDINALSDENA